MPTFFIHLENALKRANEFIEVGNKTRALEILCDVLHSKKHRTWQKKHEEIMNKYLELCVELKQSYVAKEGIYQYKIICQQSYVSSFEDAIRKYISMAEERAEHAKEQSQANIEDIDDLENAQTPEDILMSAVSNEGNQDRKDRVVLIPWVKFLWESYRQCLDLLRHNARTEALYHEIARKAFDFCIRYNRKSEFRKLCDHLHLHLDQLKRQQNQNQQNINLNDPETQTMHLETRLLQLDLAIQMELWQEAYKATDDIKKFNLMGSGKRGLGKPSLIASYYQKLALVFWKANSPLFHAAALFRHFHLNKDLRKNLKLEEAQKLASRLVIATLSIPVPAIRPEIDKLVDTEENIIDQHHRNLSILLGITSKPPTRASLVKDLKRMGVLQHATQAVQDLYLMLEVEFNPLGICGRVQQSLTYLENAAKEETQLPEVVNYASALKEITVIRLIREVSQVYRTIEFTRLSELCPFVDRVGLERLMVESARRHDLQVRIDHRRKCFVFGNELRVSTGEEFTEGPYLQSMPNEQMRRQLVTIYSSLQKAVNLLDPEALNKKRDEMKRTIMKTYFQNANDDHSKILLRQEMIEQRKELIERLGAEREEHERRRAEEQAAKIREAEEQRLLEESRQRERLKREKEENDLRRQMNLDQLSKFPELNLDEMDADELANLKPQDMQRKRVEQFEKERKEALAKQRKIERKIDHFERAKRIEEIPLLKAEYEKFKVLDKEVWAQFQEVRIETLKKEREIAIQERERFRRVLDDKKAFTERVLQTRQNEYAERVKEFEKVVEEEREKRLNARKEKRIEERRYRYNREKEAKRLALQEEIQRKRSAEIEERIREERAQAMRKIEEMKGDTGSEAASWRRPASQTEAPPLSRNRYNESAPPPPPGGRMVSAAADGGGSWRRDGEQKPYGGRGSDSRDVPSRPSYGGRDSRDRRPEGGGDWRSPAPGGPPPPPRGDRPDRADRENDWSHQGGAPPPPPPPRGDRGDRADRGGDWRSSGPGGPRGDREGGPRGDREGGPRGDREGGPRGDREGGPRGDREGSDWRSSGAGGPRGGGRGPPPPAHGRPEQTNNWRSAGPEKREPEVEDSDEGGWSKVERRNPPPPRHNDGGRTPFGNRENNDRRQPTEAPPVPRIRR